MKISNKSKIILIVVFILVFDQVLKIWVKTSMQLGDEIVVFKNWFILHFVENNGMAFGFEIAGGYGKMILSIFRLIAVGAIGWYMFRLLKKPEIPFGFVLSIALIFTGAIGNIIDSLFYGLIFNHSYGQVATLFPAGGGYGTFLHGRVVDMLYFPLIDTIWPSWVPFLGGKELEFFRPVFNIADSAITTGIFSILIFYRNFFGKEEKKEEMQEEIKEETPVNPEENTEDTVQVNP